jgi:5-(carboxyamino)imidazole ribonucleotide synthase
MKRTVLPGATIGVLGSGQLGRMFAISARRLGYRVHVLSPDDDTPTGQVADVEWQSSYGDLDTVARFARQVDVVTFEFENVPVETIDVVEKFVPVFPGGHVLHTTQHRLREKTFLRNTGIPVTPFLAIQGPADLEAAGAEFFPGVLKTAAWGYDGKGQTKIESRMVATAAWTQSKSEQAILEKYVDFRAELSVVAVRGPDGAFASYGPIANTHRSHILDVSVAPGDFPQHVADSAIEITRAILHELDVIGVLCVEFFLTPGGELLVNELAPRPHNSGHLTVDAYAACQFEQQVRAVCGLPLAATTQLRPAAMVNLLGDLWQDGTPDWASALAIPDVKLHLYGKQKALPGRKMGHLTVLADTAEWAAKQACAARQRLMSQHDGSAARAEQLPDSRAPSSGCPGHQPA